MYSGPRQNKLTIFVSQVTRVQREVVINHTPTKLQKHSLLGVAKRGGSRPSDTLQRVKLKA